MYDRILSTFYGSFWAIMPERLEEIEAALRLRIANGPMAYDDGHAEDKPAPPYTVANGVAVMPIAGTIYPRGGASPMSGLTTSEQISAAMKQARNDPAVQSVVLDVNTPGGAVAGVREAAAAIRGLGSEKRVHAVVNHMAASAGYWLASQATTITSTPSGAVGSIGVIARHIDKSKLIEDVGLKITTMATSKYKAEGSPIEPLADETKAEIMRQMMDIHADFVGDVARGRRTTASKVDTGYGQGRVLYAKDALAAGMIDGIGTLDDVIAAEAKAIADRQKFSMRQRMVGGI